MKAICLFVLLFASSGCVTHGVGELDLEIASKNRGTVVFGVASYIDDSLLYGGEMQILDLKTKKKYFVPLDSGNTVHKLQILNLPEGVYAIVEFKNTHHAGNSVQRYWMSYPNDSAAWFVVESGRTNYLGSVILVYHGNKRFESCPEEDRALLSESGKKDFKMDIKAFVSDCKEKQGLVEKWGLAL